MSRPIDLELGELRERSLWRVVREMASAQAPGVVMDQRKMINFSSNDYLGLATEPLLIEAAKVALDEYGVGSGSSRLICGTLSPHLRLEEQLAEFKRTEAALAFSSGYAAAVGMLGALGQKGDVMILDKLAHASLIDGARLSGAKLRIFPHNDMEKLESHLGWANRHFPEGRVMVITESVFSMDGDVARLGELVRLKERYGAILVVDEAHGVGVLGAGGRGLAEALGLGEWIDVQMGTLSKALGGTGGYVCGSRRLIELLINRSRSLIYSTAPSPASVAVGRAAVAWMLSPAGEERRENLWENLRYFRRKMPKLFGEDGVLHGAILPLILGAEEVALEAAQTLFQEGFLVPAIRFPSVPRGAARLRLTVSARHTFEQIDGLCAELERIKRGD